MSSGVEDARHVSMKLPSPSASSTANHGGGPLPKNPSGMLSTVSSSVIGDHSEISTGGLGEAAESGMVIEQWHYRPRGYAGCSSPVGGVILCILACLLLLLVFVVFYPMVRVILIRG